MPSSSALDLPFQSPPLGLLATEPLRALFDYLAAHMGSGPTAIGDGHPVVVYPGLAGSAVTTSHLRGFLADSGFAVHDWEGGVNTGPDGHFEEWLEGLERNVRDLHGEHGRTVSLVGWSLGGVYAREIAKRCPQSVRQVVTLGTPFASLGGANRNDTVYQLVRRDSGQLTPELQSRLRQRPPVPTTSIYSKSDGIVPWQGCIEKRTDRSESVEVTTSHLGMGSHPEVMRIVAERLAQPEGQWRPIAPSARRRSRR